MTANDSALIVDAHAQTIKAIRDGLRELGLQDINVAADSQRALKRVAEYPYALMIVDADVGGLMLVDAPRLGCKDVRTRYLFFSGRADSATVLTLKAQSVSGFHLKPYSIAQLNRVVSRAIGENPRRTSGLMEYPS